MYYVISSYLAFVAEAVVSVQMPLPKADDHLTTCKNNHKLSISDDYLLKNER